MWPERIRRFWRQHLDALATEIAPGRRRLGLKALTSHNGSHTKRHTKENR
jgi:hypothetical protein